MKIPSFFMGKIIVTLFPFTDIPSGMKPSATKSSVLTRHPSSALNSRKVPKMPCFCGFYGVGSNEPVDEPSGFKRRGKIKLYQRRSYYALKRTCKSKSFFQFIIDTQTSVLLTWRKIFSFCSIIFHRDIYWTLHLYYRQTAMFRGIIAMPFTAKMQHWSAGNGNIGRTAEETQRRGIHRL